MNKLDNYISQALEEAHKYHKQPNPGQAQNLFLAIDQVLMAFNGCAPEQIYLAILNLREGTRGITIDSLSNMDDKQRAIKILDRLSSCEIENLQNIPESTHTQLNRYSELRWTIPIYEKISAWNCVFNKLNQSRFLLFCQTTNIFRLLRVLATGMIKVKKGTAEQSKLLSTFAINILWLLVALLSIHIALICFIAWNLLGIGLIVSGYRKRLLNSLVTEVQACGYQTTQSQLTTSYARDTILHLENQLQGRGIKLNSWNDSESQQQAAMKEKEGLKRNLGL